MTLTELALAAQLLAAGVMVGVIWAVQLLVYPAFASVSLPDWTRHHTSHSRRITWIVLPAMATEVVACAWLACVSMSTLAHRLALANLVLVLSTWVVTAYVARRHHRRLTDAWHASTIQSLVRVNWVRTALWSARAVLGSALVIVAT